MNILINTLKNRKYDYDYLYNHPKTIKILNNDKCDINVIIGVKGRKKYLDSTIKYLIKSINKYNVSITVVEIDTESNNIDICEKYGINYIFVPIDIINTENLYSRALSFNIGYLFTLNSNYYLFHDCDILVDDNFFKILFENYINDNFKWLQTFTGKRLKMLGMTVSNHILDGDIVDLKNVKDFIYAKPGAAGGSTLVKSEIFNEVGGFDPEIFYGYAPEDSLFFTKLCCLERKIDNIISCHQCDNIHYADNPPIELYHINHPPTINENKFYAQMMYCHNTYWSFNYDDKLEYIKIKKDFLSKYLKK